MIGMADPAEMETTFGATRTRGPYFLCRDMSVCWREPRATERRRGRGEMEAVKGPGILERCGRRRVWMKYHASRIMRRRIATLYSMRVSVMDIVG